MGGGGDGVKHQVSHKITRIGLQPSGEGSKESRSVHRYVRSRPTI